MQNKVAVATALLASMAVASPLKPRQMPSNACSTAISPFQLEAVASDGTSYPLAVTFAAEFGQTLRLTANPTSPFTGSSFTEEHVADKDASTGYVFSIQHKTQTDPNGDAVQFNSTVPAADSALSMVYPSDGAPGLSKICGDAINNPTYYTVDGAVEDFSLCDGTAVDQALGRKIIHYKGTDASCQSVALKFA